MPFLSQKVNTQRFWTINFELRAQRIFLGHFYARRRGRIFIMPESVIDRWDGDDNKDDNEKTDFNRQMVVGCYNGYDDDDDDRIVDYR